MKLVEILARDVNEWLDCWVSAVQDSDGTVWFNLEDDVGPIFDADRSWVSNPCHSEIFNVSSDFQTAIVTRAQWEAERARIAELDRGQYSLMTEEAEDWRNNCQKQYEQELWDKVAVSVASTVYADAMSEFAKTGCPCEDWRDYVASDICNMADAFMAERAKRLKQ